MNSSNRQTIIVLFVLGIFLAGAVGWFGSAFFYKGDIPSLSYETLSKDEVGGTGEKRAIIEVRIHDPHPTIRELRRTAFEIWNQGNRGWDLLTIHLYLPNMDTTEEPFAIVRFTPAGIQGIRLMNESIPE